MQGFEIRNGNEIWHDGIQIGASSGAVHEVAR